MEVRREPFASRIFGAVLYLHLIAPLRDPWLGHTGLSHHCYVLRSFNGEALRIISMGANHTQLDSN